MSNGIKRETWRPQPTSSWTPGARNDNHNRQQHDSPAASGSSSNFRFSPPSGPSRAQYPPPSGQSSCYRTDNDRNDRFRSNDGGDDDEDRRRSRLDDEDRRDSRLSGPDRSGARDRGRVGDKAPEGPKMGYGRDHIDPSTRAEDRKKGTFRTRAQIEADNRRNGLAPNAHVVAPLHHQPHHAHHTQSGTGSGRREDRSWSAWRQKVDEGDRRLSGGAMDRAAGGERFRHGSPGGRRADLSPASETRGRGGAGGSMSSIQREAPRGRRPSPDYATGQTERKRSRSPSRDSLYSPLPRRRSLSPPNTDILPPLDRKRGPPSPRASDPKRLRDISPSRSITSSRRRRSPSRSTTRSRSRERFRARSPSPRRFRQRSPSPPLRHPRRSPSPFRHRRRSPSPIREPVKMRQWGKRESPNESAREHSPIPPPRVHPNSPPRGNFGRQPLPPQSNVFRPGPQPPHRRGSPPPTNGPPHRGPPFGGWGRAPGAQPPQEAAFRPPPGHMGRPPPSFHQHQQNFNGATSSYDLQESDFDQRLPSHQQGPSFPAHPSGTPSHGSGRPPVRPPQGDVSPDRGYSQSQSSQTGYLSPRQAFSSPQRSLHPATEVYPPTISSSNAYPTPPNQPFQSAQSGAYASNLPPYSQQDTFGSTNGHEPGQTQLSGTIGVPAPEPLHASGFKISFGGSQASPTKGDGWKNRAPAVKQFFEDSGPPSPSSRPPSPSYESRRPRSRSRSPVRQREPDRPPLQRPEIYLDLLDRNERDYSAHLSTVAPYIRAAFDQWYSQGSSSDLQAFLIHYLGRRPDPPEVAQIETLLGRRTRYSRDQEELRLLHSQAIDLRNGGSHGARADGGEHARHRSPEKLGAAPPRGAASMASELPSATAAATIPFQAQDIAPSGPAPQALVDSITPSSRTVSRSSVLTRPAVDGELYERIAHVGEGTYGKVYKARNVETGVFYALKRIRMEGEKDGFPVTAMREIKLLQKLKHRNVLRLVEMMVSKGSVYMVLEYMDHDLTGVLAQPNLKFSPANLKSLNYQMLSGLAYLHDQGILHRDMKGSNILLNAAGELKLADFGLARAYSKHKRDDYTNRVITLWYRGPELLLGETVYGPEVDMWSAGCIMLELFCGKPVFQGNDEIHQLEVIYSIMGTPDEEAWPAVKDLPWYELVKPKEALPSRFEESFAKWLSPAALELAQGLLAFDSTKRLSAEEAMRASYFTDEEPGMEMPTQLANCGEHHEMSAKQDRARRRQQEGR